MKFKSLFRMISLLALLVSFGSPGNVSALLQNNDPLTPSVSTLVTPASINVGDSAVVVVSLNHVPAEGYTSAEFACTYNSSLVEISNTVFTGLFGSDAATAITGSQNGGFIAAIAGSNGNKATASGGAFTFNVKGLQAGQSAVECKARVSKGDNVLTEIPSTPASLSILGSAPTPTPTVTVTPTSPVNNWLTFTNSKYSFEFKYPPDGQIADGRTDNFARIDLPFAAGTNLSDKYLEVIVVENAGLCQSPLAFQSILGTSETITINGISFLKQTGGDGGVGHLYEWVAYSTLRDNVCVSLDFILHSLNPGNFETPPPVFDFAAESAVFEQIVSTYAWLDLPIVTPTYTPTPTSTPTSEPDGMLTGQVLASKPVTVSLYNADNLLVTSVTANVDGTFNLTVLAGDYTVIATASGFLSAQGSVTLTGGNTSAMPTVSLPAGDIDGNNVIDQFDALTIGMSYNTQLPAQADLNNDGIINVLDLELLAANYRKSGALVW